MRIKDTCSYEIEINKSRFICYLKRVESEAEFKDFLSSVKKQHPKATHHCTALLIDQNIQRSSDDGEPGGTAGIPMLEVLRKRNMEKICAVTVRYFGGVLLGAGGLIRAYSRSVSEALDHAEIFDVQKLKVYEIAMDYSTAARVEKYFNSLMVLNREYEENVRITFASAEENIIKKTEEVTLGKYSPVYLYEDEVEVRASVPLNG